MDWTNYLILIMLVTKSSVISKSSMKRSTKIAKVWIRISLMNSKRYFSMSMILVRSWNKTL